MPYIEKYKINDTVGMNDSSNIEMKDNNKHYLKGVIGIFREDLDTGKREFVDKSTNIIPISGMQYVLMKMFGLHLDSSHNTNYEEIDQDTTLVTPDLNEDNILGIGVDKSDYSVMNSDISENHFVQGFVVGNGGSGEDAITTKNTDYSFVSLRNAIPFQQTQMSGSNGLDSSIAGKYLGVYRQAGGSTVKSYYIKKFDTRPHIYHSWWRDGQKWDYLDPVQTGDLGPDAKNGVGKTNRIETYVQMELSINPRDGDCLAYFNHDGSTQTAMINEIGLVAFDTIPGQRSIVETLYKTDIKKLIKLIFDNNRGDVGQEIIDLSKDIFDVLKDYKGYNHTKINNFIDNIEVISNSTVDDIDYKAYQDAFCSDTNISVEAFYNQSGTFIYATDKFLDYMSDIEFNGLSVDEAQRIKLVTYYTFNSIPLKQNTRLIFEYRIYAN